MLKKKLSQYLKQGKMQMLKNLQRRIIKTTVFLVLFSIFLLPVTWASFYEDDETSSGNKFSANNLDMEFVSSEDNFDPDEDIYPTDELTRDATVENVGNMPFIYMQEYEFVSGEEDLCNALELVVNVDSTQKYSGLLSDYLLTGATDPDLALDPGEDHEYEYLLTLPFDADDDLADKECEFNIRTTAWQVGYLPNTAFWDDEVLENSIETIDWTDATACACTTEILDIEHNSDPDEFDTQFFYKYKDALVRLTTIRSYEGDEGEQEEVYLDGELVGKTTALYEGMTDVEDEFEFVLETGGHELDFEKIKHGADWHRIKLEIIGCSADEKDIIINEVMWMGSTVSDNDEWMELYNDTDDDINLDNWVLKNGGDGEDLVFPEDSVISAHNYFLIANFDEDDENSALSDENVSVDWVVEELDLDDDGEELILEDSTGNKIDEAGGWDAGENDEERKSMERNNDPDSGWHTCTDDACNDDTYWDENDGKNYGTPRSENHSEKEEGRESDSEEDEPKLPLEEETPIDESSQSADLKEEDDSEEESEDTPAIVDDEEETSDEEE